MLRSNECGKHLNLNGSIGNVIFAAQHVGHAHFEVVDSARQHIEPRAVGAAYHGVGQLCGVEFLLPAHAVLPHDRRVVIELEAPVRRDSVGFLCRAIFLAQGQGRAVIDGRQSAAELDLALQLQLLRGFVAGVDAAIRLQGLERRLVMRKPLGLTLLSIGLEAEPTCIVENDAASQRRCRSRLRMKSSLTGETTAANKSLIRCR